MAQSVAGVASTSSGFFFEGREKLLEIWFQPPAGAEALEKHADGYKLGLRAIERSDLDEMLAIVKCTVLGSKHNRFLDSYVLSESSMFVSAYRIIIKVGSTLSLEQQHAACLHLGVGLLVSRPVVKPPCCLPSHVSASWRPPWVCMWYAPC
jgi:S-adenosylmethionine decarboxylase